MSMPIGFRPIEWAVKDSDGTPVCSECHKIIPVGEEVHIRDGRYASIEAYPEDPSTFCAPCVLPGRD